MRLHEFQSKIVKPKTPDQQRVANLRKQSKNAAQAVKAELARQQQRKAQQALVKSQQPIVTL